MNAETKDRNIAVDIIRAFAIIMVVLGHCISVSSSEYESSLLFQIIWSLQMPLFFILSGYLTKYSKPIVSLKDLCKRIWKKTLAYIVPWLVWTFLIRGIIFQQKGFFDIISLIYHMDSGYWFLFALWIIVIAFDLCSYFAVKLVKNNERISYILMTIFFFIVFTIALFVIGRFVGFELLGIKLIVYYIPFYTLGFIFGKLIGESFKVNHHILANMVSFICGLIWLALIINFNLYSMDETLLNIAIRYCASTAGCVAFCWAIVNIYTHLNEKISKQLIWIGKHTLEIYVMHDLLLGYFKITDVYTFASSEAFIVIILNFIVVFGLTVAITWIIENNKVARKILFWK